MAARGGVGANGNGMRPVIDKLLYDHISGEGRDRPRADVWQPSLALRQCEIDRYSVRGGQDTLPHGHTLGAAT